VRFSLPFPFAHRSANSNIHSPTGILSYSEYKPDFRLKRPWRNKMSPGKCREEVIQRDLVRQIGDAKTQRRAIPLAMKQIVRAEPDIEDMPRRDTRRVMISVGRAGCRHDQPSGPEVRAITGGDALPDH